MAEGGGRGDGEKGKWLMLLVFEKVLRLVATGDDNGEEDGG